MKTRLIRTIAVGFDNNDMSFHFISDEIEQKGSLRFNAMAIIRHEFRKELRRQLGYHLPLWISTPLEMSQNYGWVDDRAS